jgi:hypothetical protein
LFFRCTGRKYFTTSKFLYYFRYKTKVAKNNIPNRDIFVILNSNIFKQYKAFGTVPGQVLYSNIIVLITPTSTAIIQAKYTVLAFPIVCQQSSQLINQLKDSNGLLNRGLCFNTFQIHPEIKNKSLSFDC